MDGALVPAVKSEQQHPSTADAPSQPMLLAAEEEAETETDKDTLCPICMEIIKDAFLTACGHSFCYMCIFTHLRNKNDCPCCGSFLTTKHIFPNLLLNKVSCSPFSYHFYYNCTHSDYIFLKFFLISLLARGVV